MVALRRAPAAEDLPFQRGLHGYQQRRMVENIRAVFLDDLLAIAVGADHEGIAPFRGPANIDVERCAFAVHDFCGLSACHKRLLIVLLDGVLGNAGSQGRSASGVPLSLDPAARMETRAGREEVHYACG